MLRNVSIVTFIQFLILIFHILLSLYFLDILFTLGYHFCDIARLSDVNEREKYIYRKGVAKTPEKKVLDEQLKVWLNEYGLI